MKSHARILIVILLAAILILSGVVLAAIFFTAKTEQVMEEYLAYWQKLDTKKIFYLTTTESMAEYGSQEINRAYQDFFSKTAFQVEQITEVTEVTSSWQRVQMRYTARLASPYFGEQDLTYQLILKRERLFYWRIEWDYSLVHPLLRAGDSLVVLRHLPDRGTIFDRNGEPLARKGEAVTIGIQPGQVENEDLLTRELQQLLGLSPDWVKARYKKVGIQPHWFVPIKNLNIDLYTELTPLLHAIPGVFFRKIERRVYPDGELTAHITGYIGEANRDWLAAQQGKDYRKGDLVGRAGIERSYEEILRGRPGYSLLIKNGKDQRILFEQVPVRGSDLYLTIDLAIQRLARQVLDNKPGVIVVLGPKSGEVLAIANNPSYDANLFALGMSPAEWEQLRDNPQQPLFNRALLGLYPPGSVFKVITAGAALDLGLVIPDAIFADPGQYYVQGNIVRNFQDKVHGEHSFAEALTDSINTTFAEVGLKLGVDNLIDYARRFDWEEQLDFPLPVNSGKLGEINNQVELAWSTIGQARVVATPFQMARVIAAVAAGGLKIKPLLINKIRHYQVDGKEYEEYFLPEEGSRVIKAETAELLTELLEKVIVEGTGSSAGIEGLSLAGKTGTAEISSNSEVSHAWFVCFAPLENPQLAISVFLEEGGIGGEDAAPIARDFLKQFFKINDEQGHNKSDE